MWDDLVAYDWFLLGPRPAADHLSLSRHALGFLALVSTWISVSLLPPHTVCSLVLPLGNTAFWLDVGSGMATQDILAQRG